MNKQTALLYAQNCFIVICKNQVKQRNRPHFKAKMWPVKNYSYSTTLIQDSRNSRSCSLPFTDWDAATMGIHF